MKSLVRMERLERHHRKSLAGFENQHDSLTRYLKHFALRHEEKDRLSRTWLAIATIQEQDRVAGFYTLAMVSVERSAVNPVPSLQKLPAFPIPGVLLAQMAVDRRAQGQGLGRYLLEEALGHALRIRDEVLSCRLFVTDAIDEEAVAFYQHFGMTRLSDTLPARMILDMQTLLPRAR